MPPRPCAVLWAAQLSHSPLFNSPTPSYPPLSYETWISQPRLAASCTRVESHQQAQAPIFPKHTPTHPTCPLQQLHESPSPAPFPRPAVQCPSRFASTDHLSKSEAPLTLRTPNPSFSMSGVEFRKPLNPCDLSTPALVPFRDPGSWTLEPLHGKCYAAATEPGIERMVPWFIGLHCLVTVQRILAKKRPSSQRPGQHGSQRTNTTRHLPPSIQVSSLPAASQISPVPFSRGRSTPSPGRGRCSSSNPASQGQTMHLCRASHQNSATLTISRRDTACPPSRQTRSI